MQVSTRLFTGGLLRCGRAYRNGQAVIYVNKSDLSIRTTSKEMKKYCVKQQMCRRSIIMFLLCHSTSYGLCMIYSKNWECTDCKCKAFLSILI